MSKNLNFLSLTDGSLLIQDASFTGAEFDTLTANTIGFFDAKITHNQLYRYYFHDLTKVDEVFDRVATYRRKFLEPIAAEEKAYKEFRRDSDETALFDATQVEIDWLRIRKFSERVSVKDFIDPRKVRTFRDSFTIGEERVEKLLPPITDSDLTVVGNELLNFILTKGALPLQSAAPQDDLLFVGKSNLSREVVKTFDKLNFSSGRTLDTEVIKLESDYYDLLGNVSGLLSFQSTKAFTKDAVKFNEKTLFGGQSNFLRDKIKLKDSEVFLVGKNVIRKDNVSAAAAFIDPTTLEQLLKRFAGKTIKGDVAYLKENLLSTSLFNFETDKIKVSSLEDLFVGKIPQEDIVVLGSDPDPASAAPIVSKTLGRELGEDELTSLLDRAITVSKSRIEKDIVQVLNPTGKNLARLIYNNYSTRDVEEILISAQRSIDPLFDNFVNLKPGLVKKENVRIDDRVVTVKDFDYAADLVNFGQDTFSTVHNFYKASPILNFSQEEALIYWGLKYNEPALIHPSVPNTNNNRKDPYYNLIWEKRLRYLRDLDGSFLYPDIASTLGVSAIDDDRREDYAFIDDGHGYVKGDSDPYYAPSSIQRPIPFWNGQYWQFPVVVNTATNFPSHNSSGRRVNLGARKYTAEDLAKGQKIIYNSLGQIVEYKNLGLGAPTGEILWDSLRKLGITLGRFQLRSSRSIIDQNAKVKSHLIEVSKSPPKSMFDRVGAFFYPFQGNPQGEPEDVKIKKSLGIRRDLAILIGLRQNLLKMQFSEFNSRPGEIFKGKDLVAALANQSNIFYDRFNAFFYPRGTINPDVLFGHGNNRRDIIKAEINFRKFNKIAFTEFNSRPGDIFSSKEALIQIAKAQKQVVNSEKIIALSTSKNFIKRSIHEGDKLLDLIEDKTVNVYTTAPTSGGGLVRYGSKLYATYSALTTRNSHYNYEYTNLNTYTATYIPDYERVPYYFYSSLGVVGPYTGNYTYSQGLAYDGLLGGVVSSPGQAYYPNASNAGFLWDRRNNYWVFVSGVPFGFIINPTGNYPETVTPLTGRTTSTNPGLGNISLPDLENGGLLNYTILQPPSVPTISPFTVYYYTLLGEIESIFKGDAPHPPTNYEGGKIYRHTNGHLYVFLDPFQRSNGGNYLNTYSSQWTGTFPSSAGWVQASYRTKEDLTPPNELLSILSAIDSEFSRLAKYDKKYTETIKVADTGSAFIPVYCASYFLEPYVSEAGKNAKF